MDIVVEIVEDHDVVKFKNKMEEKLRNFNKNGIKIDVKFSATYDDGYRMYTAMIIASN